MEKRLVAADVCVGGIMQELTNEEVENYEYFFYKALGFSTPKKEATIFDTALKSHFENPITELIAFFINPNESHGLGDSFYNGFISSLNALDELRDFEFGQFNAISTQETTTSGKRIDLWVETDTALIIVELKVNHIQNNPFKDYARWGNNKLKQINKETERLSKGEKKLVTLVLSLYGESEEEGWYAFSYNHLTEYIRGELAIQLLNSPLNKWGVFARDFLLHLDSFIEHWEPNMKRLNFVVDNMQKISALIELREQAYGDITDHINTAIQKAIQDYEPYNKTSIWEGTPAIRFGNNQWNDWSETVLNLQIDRNPMSCTLTMFVDNQTEQVITKVSQAIKRSKYPFVEGKYEQNKKFWYLRWEFATFDLESITAQVVFLQKLLQCVEHEWK